MTPACKLAAWLLRQMFPVECGLFDMTQNHVSATVYSSRLNEERAVNVEVSCSDGDVVFCCVL